MHPLSSRSPSPLVQGGETIDRLTIRRHNKDAERAAKPGQRGASTANGSGSRWKRKLEETESELNRATDAEPLASSGRTETLLDFRYSSSELELESTKTTEARRTLKRTIRPVSPDEIDALSHGTSPVPNHSLARPNIATPLANSTARLRPATSPDILNITQDKSRSRGRSKPGSILGVLNSPETNAGPRPQPTGPRAWDREEFRSSHPLSSLFKSGPRKVTVSTSVVASRKAASESRTAPRQQSLEDEARKAQQAKGSMVRTSNAFARPAKQTEPKARGEKKTIRASPSHSHLSDDDSRLPSSDRQRTDARSTKKGRKLNRDKEMSEDLDRRTLDEADARAKCEREAMKKEIEEEEQHRKAQWQRAENYTRRGESFFASAGAVDIAETEQRIARAQAAIE